MMLAQSFAKNFGLYGERAGTLSVLCADAAEAERVASQLKIIIRPMYSSPPIHGALIVSEVLSDEKLRQQYYDECRQMAERINAMRKLLVEQLYAEGSQHDWSPVQAQIGMFAFTGLAGDMVAQLTAQYNIFLTKDGRISLAGVTPGNVGCALHAAPPFARSSPQPIAAPPRRTSARHAQVHREGHAHRLARQVDRAAAALAARQGDAAGGHSAALPAERLSAASAARQRGWQCAFGALAPLLARAPG